jgi:hypothetical protein
MATMIMNETSTTAPTGPPDTTQPITTLKITTKHQSLISLWEEWHGLGNFPHSEGGTAGKNKKYETKW